MTGKVIQSEALLNIIFNLEDGKRIAIEFVVDTGFAGGLTLPQMAIDALKLPFYEAIETTLANGQIFLTSSHVGAILWNGSDIRVVVLAMESRPLLGTSLLEGNRLGIEFQENGLVVVSSM